MTVVFLDWWFLINGGNTAGLDLIIRRIRV